MLALVVGAGVVTWLRIPRDDVEVLEAGGLQLGADVPEATADGGVTVTVRPGEAAQVSIATDQGTVWSSDPGHAFLGAGRGTLEAEEDRGYFWLRTEHDHRWTTQRLDSVTTVRNAVVLEGVLLDADGDPGPA